MIKVFGLILIFGSIVFARGVGDVQLQKSVESFSRLNQKTSQTCKTKDDFCPQIVKALESDDASDGFLGLLKSQESVCAQYEKEAAEGFAFGKDMANHFNKNIATGLGPVVQSQIRRCARDDDPKSKRKVAKYYYYYLRSEQSQINSLREMSAIDMISGKPPLQDYECRNLNLESVKQECESIQSKCREKGDLKALAADSKIERIEIKELKKLKDKLEAEPRKSQQIKEKIALLNMDIETALDRNPWMRGAQYQEDIKAGKSEEVAIQNQLALNRKEQKTKMGENSLIQVCLSGGVYRGCDAQNLRKRVEENTSPLAISYETHKDKRSPQSLSATKYLEFEQCLHETGVAKKQASDTLQHASIDIGLLLMTWGASSLVGGAKGLVNARAMVMARFAEGVQTTIGGGQFLVSMNKAITVCSDKYKLNEQNSSNSKACDFGTLARSPQAVRAYDNCVSSLMWASLDAATLGTGKALAAVKNSKLTQMEKIVKKEGTSKEELKTLVLKNAQLSDPERIAKIKSDFPHLSADQVSCIVNDVHTIGAGRGVYTYTKGEIHSKVRTLRKNCMITSAQDIEALIRLGYAGGMPGGSTPSAFEELLNQPRTNNSDDVAQNTARVAANAAPTKTAEELTQEVAQLEDQLKKSGSPLERLRLRKKLTELEKERVKAASEEDKGLFEKMLDGPVGRERVGSGREDAPLIQLSAAKKAQLANEGREADVIQANKEVIFESGKTSNFGKLKGLDPKNPDNFLIEVRGAKDELTTVSVPQTQVALTDAEIQKALAKHQGSGPTHLEELLTKKGPTPKEIADQLARKAMEDTYRADRRVLFEKLEKLETQHGRDPIANAKNPEIAGLYKQIEALDKRHAPFRSDEVELFDALHEVDLNRTLPTPQEKDLIEQIGKIVNLKTSNHLSPSDQQRIDTYNKVKEALEQAPIRAQNRAAATLQRLSQGGGSVPTRVKLNEGIKLTKPHATVMQPDYEAASRLFKQSPSSLDSETQDWLRRKGPLLLKDLPAESSDPAVKFFRERLELYILYDRAH